MSKLKYLGLYTIMLLGCSEPPPLSLRYSDREVVDSLYNLEYEKIIDSLNTKCETLTTSKMNNTIDSILRIRLIEVAKQKNRYKNETYF